MIRKRLTPVLLIIALLIFSGCGNSADVSGGEESSAPQSYTETSDDSVNNAEKTEDAERETDSTDASAPETVTSPVDKPSVETAAVAQETDSCTISVSLGKLKDNVELLPEAKRSLVPESGMLLDSKEVEISDGDSAFDVLCIAAKDAGLQMEYSTTPGSGAYLEGIGNIYEFDAGGTSGWCYVVNGEVPNVGCSDFTVSDGDVIEFKYTLDWGNDM